MAKVSVVMSVHNGLPYLKEAVDSILQQTLTDLELIIIDDASTDASALWLEKIGDPRVRILYNEQQRGLSASLNRGAAAASGVYIARMDADDISQSGRLAAQVNFLDNHPTISLVGTWARTIGDGRTQIWRYPTEHVDIRCALLFHSVLVHSAVMWRRAAFEHWELRYDEDIDRAQDYDLWARAAEHLRFANIARMLQLYRLHTGQVGRREVDGQQVVADSVRARQLADLGVEADADELKLHNDLGRWRLPEGLAGLDRVEAWLNKLIAANQRAQRYPEAAFVRDLGARWLFACRHAVPRLGIDAWRRFKESELSEEPSSSERAKLWSKAFLSEIRGRN